MTLPRISTNIKNGSEPFHENDKTLSFTLLDFWKWNASDILSNATQGRLAEFIVATALEIPINRARDEWLTWDLTTVEGIKVEVKSAAYIQGWFQKEFSKISFGVHKTKGWDPETNKQDATSKRHADVYVFALLSHKDQATIDPLNIVQWEFYVLTTEILDHRKRSQHSITLPSLVKLCPGIPYHSLSAAVLRAAGKE